MFYRPLTAPMISSAVATDQFEIENLKTVSTNSSFSISNEFRSLSISDASTTSTTENNIPLNPSNEFLNHIDPTPAYPPSYSSVNPNKSVRYPIYESSIPANHDDKPPEYKAAVHDVTVISMKVEWLSPFEISHSRSWKNLILELNSTQLNFYRIDDRLISRVSSNGSFELTKDNKDILTHLVKRDKEKYLTNDNLFKSYSLQFAKFGIPIDYKKKSFVIRMRCEVEQFLINFFNVDDMLLWTVLLNMGINVSLDLQIREFPNYRIVPRRRRRRRRHRGGRKNKSRNFGNFEKIKSHKENVFTKNVNKIFNSSNCDIVQNKNKIKFKMSNFLRPSKNRKKLTLNSVIEEEDYRGQTDSCSPSNVSSRVTSRTRSVSKSISVTESRTQFPFNECQEMLRRNSMLLQSELDEFQNIINEHIQCDSDSEQDEEVHDEGYESEEVESRTQFHAARHNSIYSEEGVYYEEDEEDDDDFGNFRRRRSSTLTNLSNIPYGSNVVKWSPPIKEISRKRYIRDSLRCIKPLTEESQWVGSIVFKSCSPPVYKTNNYVTSEVEHKWNAKNHYLKPFIVGPVGFLKADTKFSKTLITTKKSRRYNGNIDDEDFFSGII
ncbi:hypothetical protein KAFR_0F00570 [Kazachstania africana CBS 2517]|uniref:PH domain-containing protein n=1 Tax=Kazachstania africana (strain ATCC 22294 / BCRC 22015 / CBS 2517 / CECT 1963 / NBRC 1671 / NRRL Y-8276) TaxID=1071382 RepID=H2AWA4_KAZAF|nr:hypothetical protein KAFR_0F00570 [Kazachstania africana CBS 2517]CCF58654.1 hypothetical protein KAFR_0F00570 [Kazachstania africana CBS 2517]